MPQRPPGRRENHRERSAIFEVLGEYFDQGPQKRARWQLFMRSVRVADVSRPEAIRIGNDHAIPKDPPAQFTRHGRSDHVGLCSRAVATASYRMAYSCSTTNVSR